MKREQLKSFMEEEVYVVLKEQLGLLDELWRQDKNQLKEQLVHEFSQLWSRIIELQKNNSYTVAFLCFTMLRTRMQKQDLKYQVMLYDVDWFMKDGINSGDIDVSMIYQFYIHTWDSLIKRSKKYGSNIREHHVELIMQTLLKYFHKYVIKLLRYSILEGVELEEYDKIRKETRFCIGTGEMFCEADYIYIDNQGKTDIFELRDKMEEKQPLPFEDLRRLELSKADFSSMNLEYTNFRGANLTKSDFSNALLNDTKFSKCNLQECSFLWTVLHEVEFDDAHLEKANFMNALIQDTDFTKAHLEKSIFQGANLSQCIFKREQIDQLNLNEQQMKNVIIMEGDKGYGRSGLYKD